jgi:hypothetical protein
LPISLPVKPISTAEIVSAKATAKKITRSWPDYK